MIRRLLSVGICTFEAHGLLSILCDPLIPMSTLLKMFSEISLKFTEISLKISEMKNCVDFG